MNDKEFYEVLEVHGRVYQSWEVIGVYSTEEKALERIEQAKNDLIGDDGFISFEYQTKTILEIIEEQYELRLDDEDE